VVEFPNEIRKRKESKKNSTSYANRNHSITLLSPVQELSSKSSGFALLFSFTSSPAPGSTATTVRSSSPFGSGSLVPPVQYPSGEPRPITFGDNIGILFDNVFGGSLTGNFRETGEGCFVFIELVFIVYFTGEDLWDAS
jgi:hypothetical protein